MVVIVLIVRELAGILTNVYYAALVPGGVDQKLLLNDDGGTTDQFMPALDFDATGDHVITFYDRRDDTTNTSYRLYRAYTDIGGSAIQSNQDASLFSSTAQNSWTVGPFIGDYHETWNTSINGVSTWLSSWIGVNTNNNSDVFISTIQP